MGKGIPTEYAGTRFRSRLEARWAAYFDIIDRTFPVRWRWDYEPIDLEGYIPDFFLWRGSGSPALIEVKPATTVDELAYAVQKIHRTSWSGEVVILGSGLICAGSDLVVGAHRAAGEPRVWGRLIMRVCDRCRDWEPLGSTERDCPLCGVAPAPMSGVFDALWRRAGNAVQWRGR